MNLMVITNQKLRYTKNRVESKHNTKKAIKSQEKRQEMIGPKKSYKNNQKTMNKVAVSTYLSIIALDVNGLNAPIKRHIIAEWI